MSGKGWVLLAVVAFALYVEYQHRLQANRTRRGPGVARGTSSYVRQATQFASTGSNSPGSGIMTVQPDMASTWGITGGSGPGYTGPTYYRNQMRLPAGVQR
jgi:hypothetical protein